MAMSPVSYSSHLANNVLPNDPRYMSSPPITSSSSSMSGLLGAGVGAGLGILSNITGNIFQARENRRNRQFLHDEAVLAHDRQLEIMDKTNHWNSFENQRTLLEKAGYNPNKLFGNGGTIARSSGASGGAQAGSPSSLGYKSPLDASMILALSQAKLFDKQADLAGAQADKANAETKEIPLNAEVQRFLGAQNAEYYRNQVHQGQYNLDYLRKTEGIRFGELKQKLHLNTAQYMNMMATFSTAVYNLSEIMPLEKNQLQYYIDEIMPAQLAEIQAKTKCSESQASEALANAWYRNSLAFREQEFNDYIFKGGDTRKNQYLESLWTKAKNEATYWAEKAKNEGMGLPYLVTIDASSGYNLNLIGGASKGKTRSQSVSQGGKKGKGGTSTSSSQGDNKSYEGGAGFGMHRAGSVIYNPRTGKEELRLEYEY